MSVRAGAGFTPTEAQHFATKAYVDSKAGGSAGVPTFIQQTDPALSTSYIWYQTNASGVVVQVWTNYVASASATAPTTNLAYRLRPSQLGASNGQTVSSIPFEAGGVTLTPNTAVYGYATGPTYMTGGSGSQPYLRFDGSTNTVSKSSAGNGTATGTTYTLCYVVGFRNATAAQEYSSFGGTEMMLNVDAAGAHEVYAGSALTGGTVTTGTHFVMMGAAGDSTGTIQVDGTQVASGTIGNTSPDGTSVWLGSHPNQGRLAAVDLYEVLVYASNLNAAANSSTLSQLKTYVRSQYGLTVN